MHIANILTSMSNCYGGPPKVASGLGEALAGWGNKVSYWATAAQEEADVDIGPNRDVWSFQRPWPQAWYWAPGMAAKLESEISSIDILHIHEVWSYPQYAAAKIARNTNTSYIVMPHGELESRHLRHKSFAKYFKKKSYLALFGRSILGGAACLHAMTPQEIEGFRRAGYYGPVTVVPNGIDADKFTELPDTAEAENLWPLLRNRRVVLFLSRLSPEKGLDQLIPAWKRLTRHHEYNDALLVLAGPDDRGYKKEACGLVEKNGLMDSVLFTGMVSGHEKMALISRADIYALPSYCEGFSISVLENLAAGNPVLITPGCNFPEVAEANAGLCVPPEAKLLEESLRELLDMSDTDRAAMGKRGRNLVLENYTWDIAARRMLTVYQCILNGKDVPLFPKPAIVDEKPKDWAA